MALPQHLRMDNGPELISWALRDWCRFTHTRTIYIEPGSPWENPFVESFNGRARDELLEHRGVHDPHRSPHRCRSLANGVPQRIVAIAQSQVGYSTEPSRSYCNKFSAYWNEGTAGCPSGELAEEWCADFAAWAWQEAGVQFTYGYGPGEINGGAVSFYEWGVANGEWHPATGGYVASPGDVAVYGLSVGADPSAVHVAIVTDDAPGQLGPDVVNGDGDRTGFSVVETGTDQVYADAGSGDSTLAGYVSPP